MNMTSQVLNFPALVDQRGTLIALEATREIPFQIRRVYFIKDLKGDAPRGFHAHKNLKQVVICLSGSFRLILDDGYKRDSIVMNEGSQGVLIEEMIWREMHDFTDDCLILVIASEFYTEDDYIRDYQSFKDARKLMAK